MNRNHPAQFVNSAQMYRRLLEVVANEANGDELLVYEETLVNYMSTQCEHLSGQLASGRAGQFDQFAIQAHKMELQRITYLVHRYLERRLRKLEANAPQLICQLKQAPNGQLELLSVEEVSYLKR